MKGTVSRSVTYNFVTLWTVTLWTVAHQAPLSTGFSKQEYQSGLPFPSPGYLPGPGTEPRAPVLAGGFFTAEPPGETIYSHRNKCLSPPDNMYKKVHSSQKPDTGLTWLRFRAPNAWVPYLGREL